MKFTSFLFICGWYLALIFFGNTEWLGLDVQLLVATILILLVGIPHGAIDHIIFLEENKTVPVTQFYLFYFSLMGAYILAWLFLPLWSFVFFLLLSAFHFGQSQFSDVHGVSKINLRALNFVWGTSILSGLIFYHAEELIPIFSKFSDLESLPWAFSEQLHIILLPLSTFLAVGILGFIFWKKKISPSRFFMEIFLLGLIHLSFYTLPVIIGFTLYFTTLHSTRVLVEEFDYLKERKKIFNFGQFFKLLFPYSFLSGIGGAFLLMASYWNWISISNILLALILISIVTLPHSFVMDKFYKKRSKQF
jgi:Brp/Blh family beta-carotene 15,15'-monooxygenase